MNLAKRLAPLVVTCAAAGCVGTLGGGENPETTPGTTTGSLLPVPVARLTTAQYQRTLRALFPKVTLPAVDLPREVTVGGFVNNSRSQAPSPALIEQLLANATAVATAALVDPTKVLPCKASTAAEETSCGHAFVEDLGRRAFRRPLASDEIARFEGQFDAARTAYGFPVALRMTIETLLQTPQFLYLTELGQRQSDGRYALTSYELASRLSYFLWNSMPDDALLAAAGNGELATPAGIEKQARRLLSDPQARDAVATFQEQWLRIDHIDDLSRSATSFPAWNDATSPAALRASTAAYADYLFWDRGTLAAYLTDSNGFVSNETSAFFGVPSTDATAKLLPLDPAQRSGILTYPGLMAAFAHSLDDAPVQRGVFVLDRFLCAPTPPPPPGVNQATPPQGATPKTTRERIAQTHEQGTCAGCHKIIDGIGFGFSHYDATGAWRNTDSGQPVDATGSLVGTDVDGPFDGAVALGQKLAQSKQVQSCVSTQWLRYSLGLAPNEINKTMVDPVTDSFRQKGIDVRELVVAVVKSDAFRYRVRNP